MAKIIRLPLQALQPSLVHALRPADAQTLAVIIVAAVLLRDKSSLMPTTSTSALDKRLIQSSKPFLKVDKPANHKTPTLQRTTPQFRERRKIGRKAQKATLQNRAKASQSTRGAITALRNSRRRSFSHSNY